MSTFEFTRRWARHILPKGYTKSRRFGGWSNRRKGEYVERCAKLLEGVLSFLATPRGRLLRISHGLLLALPNRWPEAPIIVVAALGEVCVGA